MADERARDHGKLTAAEAASQFKVVPLKGVKRQSGPTARAAICEP